MRSIYQKRADAGIDFIGSIIYNSLEVSSMVFHSLTFFSFTILILTLYWSTHSLKKQNTILFVANSIFYGCFNPEYLGLLFLSCYIDFYCGNKIFDSQGMKRKRFLMLSIFSNLSMLIIFKYYNFFVDSAILFLSVLNVDISPTLIHLAMPIGISYYTFQSMAYSIDVYNDEIEPERDFVNFYVFVSFFPQLVSGPIEKASNLLQQVKKSRSLNFENVVKGLFLILVGYFKKLVIADRLLPMIQAIFENTESFNSSLIYVLGVIFFWINLYCDFSGYCNIASGLAKLFGFHIMDNFRNPFFAHSPSEFFRRWQISLTDWITKYLYFPAAMKFGTPILALLVALFIMGLWHGASWIYASWGIVIFLQMVLFHLIERLYLKYIKKKFPISPLVKQSIQHFYILFIFLPLIGLYFRSNSLSAFAKAMKAIGKLFTEGFHYHLQLLYGDLSHFSQFLLFFRTDLVLALLLSFGLLIFQAFQGNQTVENFLEKKSMLTKFIFIFGVTFGLIFLRATNHTDSYIYFRF